MSKRAYLVVNFGGPRTLKEVEPFLKALLTDKDVVRTRLPQVIHHALFSRVAKKRTPLLSRDYIKIGGGSPIWADTECVADQLREKLEGPIVTFHRYLPATHRASIKELNQLSCEEIIVFPMFPQFTYATTGSIARFFLKHLSAATLQKLRWVKSYPTHPSFIRSFVKMIDDFLMRIGLSNQEELFFLFSAHGLPSSSIEEGDLYAYECQATYEKMISFFPKVKSLLCYQSKFGRGEWLRPYTVDVCQEIDRYNGGRKYCLFIPISFTSDHIETLFEVEEQYMPLIAAKGFYPFRIPALNRRIDWIEAIVQILADASFCTTTMLLRKK